MKPADHHQDRFNQSIARSYERSDRNLAEEPFRCAAVKQAILAKHPEAAVEIREARGLCTYYAQKGGLMVGYEA